MSRIPEEWIKQWTQLMQADARIMDKEERDSHIQHGYEAALQKKTTKSKTVYILSLAVDYEGDYIQGVFTTPEKAMAEKPSKNWKKDPEYRDHSSAWEWRRRGESYWVYEWEVE